MSNMVVLTRREAQIAELIAWGASKKEIASRLFISPRTVENTARNIYAKTGVSKANELSAWWFCRNFNISFNLSPLCKSIIAGVLLSIFLPYELSTGENALRSQRIRRIEIRAKRIEETTPEL